jgi:hypothetical protein
MLESTKSPTSVRKLTTSSNSKLSNVYSPHKTAVAEENFPHSNTTFFVGPKVDQKTYFSQMAHLTIDRLQKQVDQFENERNKLSEFFLQPTQELLQSDLTSAIDIKEYLTSMDTCVLTANSESFAEATPQPDDTAQVLQHGQKRKQCVAPQVRAVGKIPREHHKTVLAGKMSRAAQKIDRTRPASERFRA